MAAKSEKTLTATFGSALLAAQRDMRPVEKGSKNTHHRFNYASAEDMLIAARETLLAHGLVASRKSFGVNPEDITHSVFNVEHPDSGEVREYEFGLSAEPGKGRPRDKAELSSATETFAYFVRDLLMIPRVEKGQGDVSGRDDTDYQPRKRSTTKLREPEPKARPDTAHQLVGIKQQALRCGVKDSAKWEKLSAIVGEQYSCRNIESITDVAVLDEILTAFKGYKQVDVTNLIRSHTEMSEGAA